MTEKHIVDTYLENGTWRIKENANQIYCSGHMVGFISGKIVKDYWLNKVVSKKAKEYYESGKIHIHDLNSRIVPYCSGFSTLEIVKKGLKGPKGRIDSKPPKHLGSALNQLTNFIGVLSQEFAGAIATNTFSVYLAPFIYYDKLSYENVKQELQQFVFHLNQPSRWGECPFSNVTIDLTVRDDLKDTHVIIGGEERKTTYKEFEKEMNMINEALLEVLIEGDANGTPLTFPVITIGIDKNFPWDSEIAKKIFQVTAKYGTPFFENFLPGSGRDPKNQRSLCCRLSLSRETIKEHTGGIFGNADSMGSLSVVTINLNRIGYLAKGKGEQEYYRILDDILEVSKTVLISRRITINDFFNKGMYPYTKFYLKNYKNYFNTIGVIGGNESMLNFMGKDLMQPEAIKFIGKVLDHINEKCKEFQKETGEMFNSEGIPGESCIGGDTKIKTIDGDIPIKDLVGKSGVVVWTYNDKTKERILKKAHNIRKTRKNTGLLRIYFDDDTHLDCTPDHLIAKNCSNQWTKSSIKWIKAEKLKKGDSINSIYFNTGKGGKITVNSRQNRSNIIYEYYNKCKINKNEVIHHKNRNKGDDRLENLEKLTSTEHKVLHGKEDLYKYFPTGFGEDNPFYGHHHTEEYKKRSSKMKKGIPFKLVNITMAEFGKIMSKVAKQKTKEQHSHYRKDISTEKIAQDYKKGMKYKELTKKYGCTHGLIEGRLQSVNLNHKIVSVKRLVKKEDVYNMEVEDTKCYYTGNGVLLHNCMHSLALKDKKNYTDIITAGKDTPYLTNSTLPGVKETDFLEVVMSQEPLQTKYTGGTTLNIYLGEKLNSYLQVKNIVRKIVENTKIPYFSFSPIFSICKTCGYIDGEKYKCPKCGKNTEVFARVVGYLKPRQQFNPGKVEEFKERKYFKIDDIEKIGGSNA